MVLSAVSVLVVALSSSEIPEELMNYSVYESTALILNICHYGVRLYLANSKEDRRALSRSLGSRDRGFESHSGHGCLVFVYVCVFFCVCVQVVALR
jgi:hypothetical protein